MHAGGENVHHRAVGRRQIGGFQNALKEVIAALKLIPKGEIALRQLKIFEVARLSDRSRRTLVAAKSQQRPLDFWLVTSSVGTSTENFWRMAFAPFEENATLFNSL